MQKNIVVISLEQYDLFKENQKVLAESLKQYEKLQQKNAQLHALIKDILTNKNSDNSILILDRNGFKAGDFFS